MNHISLTFLNFSFSMCFAIFLPYHAACRIFITQLGLNLRPLKCKHGVLTTGLPVKSCLLQFLILLWNYQFSHILAIFHSGFFFNFSLPFSSLSFYILQLIFVSEGKCSLEFKREHEQILSEICFRRKCFPKEDFLSFQCYNFPLFSFVFCVL